ncbi:MAG TPA: DUF3853 family protein [Paludibacter sp.]|nr:DUF3853 family protein [Paludibacter sp.]
MNDATPIWQLTVVEFKELIRTATSKNPVPIQTGSDEFVYGIAGLADLLKVSKTTAQKLKSSGILASATTQIGRKIIINKVKALTILKVRK